MEALTIAGVAALAAGGYYSLVDLMNDLGLHGRKVKAGARKLPVSQDTVIAPQTRIKKMAGVHI